MNKDKCSLKKSIHEHLRSTYEYVDADHSHCYLFSTKPYGGSDTWCNLPSSEILAPLFTMELPADILLLHQESDLLSAADGVCRDILKTFYGQKTSQSFHHLLQFDVVIALEAQQILKEGFGIGWRNIIPGKFNEYEDSQIENFISSSKILLILRNWPRNFLDFKAMENVAEEYDGVQSPQSDISFLKYIHKKMKNSKIIIVTDKFYVKKNYKKMLSEFDRTIIPIKIGSTIDEKCSTYKSNNMKSVRKLVRDIDGWQYYTDFLSTNFKIINNDGNTSSDIIWNILLNQLNAYSKEEEISNETSMEILRNLSEIAYQGCSPFIGRMHLLASQEFRQVLGKFLHISLMKTVDIISPSDVFFSFTCQYQKQLLAAYHVYNSSQSIITSLQDLKSRDGVAANVAGHLYRVVQTNPNVISDPKTHRVLKNLFLLSEQSDNPQSYIINVLEELHCDPTLCEIFLRTAVFGRHLEIGDDALLLNPIRYIVNLSTPRKVLIIIKEVFDEETMIELLNFLSDQSVCLGLAFMNHLQWKKNYNTDKILQTVTKENSKCYLQDFLGCLTNPFINDILIPKIVPYLTCLRVRLTNSNCVVELFKKQLDLPNLMWFEVDLDLSPDCILNLALPQIISPLFDISFRSIKNEHVQSLVPFVLNLRKNTYDYISGLHIHHSSLTISGCLSILNKLKSNNMKLSAPIDVIAKYRRWRFTELMVLTNEELKDETKVHHLLGYDDRHQYSDNEIRSCYISSERELDPLIDALNEDRELIYFEYGCRDQLVIKKSSGEVEVRNLLGNYSFI